MSTEAYFFIDLDVLPQQDAVFPFNIYIYQPQGNNFVVGLHANSAYTDEIRKNYELILQKGGKLAISYRQKRTFLANLNKKEEDIPSLKPKEKSELELKREQSMKEAEASKKDFLISTELKKAISENNFLDIIEEAKKQMMSLPLNVNSTVSNMIRFADLQMHEDNFSNRVVALCYFMAKSYKIDDPVDLGDLMLASFIYDIGLTQLDSKFLTTPLTTLNAQAKIDYNDHPVLAAHLIKKSGIKITTRCEQIVLDHHERYDGTGYPNEKFEPHLTKSAQILGLVDHALAFAEGKINGEKMPLDRVVSAIKNKAAIKGLEINFNQELADLFFSLLNKNTDETKAAA